MLFRSGEKLFVVVSEFMENGSINEYVKGHIDVDRLGLVGLSFKILLIADGDTDHSFL